MEKNGRGIYGITALLLVLEDVLQILLIVVLGAAIGRPASLDEPASVNLPLIVEQREAVIVGYGSYLLYSVGILPLVLLPYRVLSERKGPASPLLTLAVGFGVVSAPFEPTPREEAVARTAAWFRGRRGTSPPTASQRRRNPRRPGT